MCYICFLETTQCFGSNKKAGPLNGPFNIGDLLSPFFLGGGGGEIVSFTYIIKQLETMIFRFSGRWTATWMANSKKGK